MTAEMSEIGKSVTVEGVTINYHDAGQGAPVLLIHGSGPGVTAWANWRTIIPELANEYRVIAPDMAGFGYTRTPTEFAATPENWVHQVVGLLDALDIKNTAIVGNSFGGAIGLKTASLYPARVSKLVLMGAVGVSFPITAGLEKVWGYKPSMEAMRELLGIFAYDQSIITEELVEMRYRASIRADVQERFARLFPSPRQECIDALALSDSELSHITIPVAVIHGREDQVIPFSASEDLASKLPNAKLYPIEHCGHWVQIEKGREFLDYVLRFLQCEDTAQKVA